MISQCSRCHKDFWCLGACRRIRGVRCYCMDCFKKVVENFGDKAPPNFYEKSRITCLGLDINPSRRDKFWKPYTEKYPRDSL